MTEVGKSLNESLFGQKVKANKCQNCKYPLEIYEIDFKKNRKMLKDRRWSLLNR